MLDGRHNEATETMGDAVAMEIRASAAGNTSAADVNITNFAYDTIRRDLLACRLKPGARVSVLALGRRISANQGAIREALSRLVAEGLVAVEPNRGFIVTPMSVGRFATLSKARTAIDALCLREAIVGADIEFEVELVAASHRVLRRVEQLDQSEVAVANYIDAHARFHEALMSRCENPWLLWMRNLLFAQSVRYRHFCVPLAREKSEFYSAEGPFLKAVFRKDTDTAEQLLITQYQRVCELISERLKEVLPS